MEWDGPFFDQEHQEWNDWKKNKRERNDLAGGPRSRMVRNDFKKVGMCPALVELQDRQRAYA